MTDLCVCKKGVGFAVVACLTAVSLTQTAPGVGSNFIDGGPCADVPSLPFTDTGDTTGLDCDGNPIEDSLQTECPESEQGGPNDVDVFYRYVANAADDAADGSADGVVRMNLETCGAGFDTKLMIYDEFLTLVDCEDDVCAWAGVGPGDGLWAASIFDANLTVGSTYYISVDSWGAWTLPGSGPYTLTLTSAGDCNLVEEQTAGNLPPCDGNESDEVPGDASGTTPPCSDAVPGNGIADNPPAINNNACVSTADSVNCNEVFCGTSGTWAGDIDCSELGDDDCGGALGSCDLLTNTCVDPTTFRDLDYVLVNIPVDVDEVILRMTAEFIPVIFFLEPTPDCDALTGFTLSGSAPCETVTLTLADATAGDYYVIATSAFDGVPAACGDAYLFELECNLACPTDLDGDGSTGFTDLTTLLGSWGACPVVP